MQEYSVHRASKLVAQCRALCDPFRSVIAKQVSVDTVQLRLIDRHSRFEIVKNALRQVEHIRKALNAWVATVCDCLKFRDATIGEVNMEISISSRHCVSVVGGILA